jgi:hypothetical protein
MLTALTDRRDVCSLDAIDESAVLDERGKGASFAWVAEALQTRKRHSAGKSHIDTRPSWWHVQKTEYFARGSSSSRDQAGSRFVILQCWRTFQRPGGSGGELRRHGLTREEAGRGHNAPSTVGLADLRFFITTAGREQQILDIEFSNTSRRGPSVVHIDLGHRDPHL